MAIRRMLTRRALLRQSAAFAALSATPAFAQSAFAQGASAQGTSPQGTWPDRAVRIIVPYPAGGSADVLARLYAEQLQVRLGQPFVVENRPGAGGNTGIDAVVKSTPDGYTLGAATIGHFAINQWLYAKMPFDPERDIVAASLTYELPNVALVASQHVPAKTIDEFVAWAKTREQVTYGSPGVGTSPHLSGALFASRTKLNGVHIPFRGAAQTIPAMLAGDVNIAIDNLASYISLIESGQMRALAITSAERWPTLPNVPTMAEAGMKDFVVTSWAALVVPYGTPRAVIDRLSAIIGQIAAEPAMKERFLKAGARILSSTPEQAKAHADKERAAWKDIVAVSGAKVE